MAKIIEEVKPIRVPRVSVNEYLHGHTCIDLFDVRTKKYERIEHDNFFTDGISSYVRDMGFFHCSVLGDSTVRGRELWKTLLGGVVLFDTELPTDPYPKYKPVGVKMVANGSFGISNSSDPAELGSYNSVESAFNEDSATMVYDWNTSQGNGQIASVALMSNTGGLIGFGNPSNTALASGSRYVFEQYMSPSNREVHYDENNQTIILMYGDKFFYRSFAVSSGAESFTVNVYKAGTSEIDVFDGTFANISNYSLYDTITFTLPEALSGNYVATSAGAHYPSCILLIPNYHLASGSSAKIYFCDVTDGTVTAYNFTNNTGYSINAQEVNGSPISGIMFFVCGTGKALVMHKVYGSDMKAFLVDFTDSTVIGEATNATLPNESSTWRCMGDKYLTDELLAFNDIIYDRELNIFLPCNGEISSPSGAYCYNANYVKDIDARIRMINNQMHPQYQKFVSVTPNSMRLMTINNLSSAVTKDASKTMKVTYTITRA